MKDQNVQSTAFAPEFSGNLELAFLEKRIAELEEELFQLKNSVKYKQFLLYKFLLQKYSGQINQIETKTIGQLKMLISDSDLTLQSLASEFKTDPYTFEINYLDSCQKAFEFVCREIEFVPIDMDLSFWLSAKEILSIKISDDDDLAVFLCSLLYCLGDENASVLLMQLEDLDVHAVVVSEFQGQFILLDACQKHTFGKYSGKKEEVLKRYSFNGKKIKKLLYKFNHSEYEQF